MILKRHYFKNPIYTIENNLELVAEISSKLNEFSFGPTIFTFSLIKNENDNCELYYLLRFLIELPPKDL